MEGMELLEKKSLEVKFDLSGTTYNAIENIGTGAYGVVCSAVDTRNGNKIAIKKVPNALGAVTLTKRTLREVKILQQFQHENILAVLDIFRSPSDTTTGDVYIVFDLLQTDLHHIIHSKQALTERHIQYFLYQILRGLKYMHSAGVIHRDLKPSNLMVNADCQLKIGDFGMARSVKPHLSEMDENGRISNEDPFMTQYVATRWYRAPELIFSMLQYSFQVDVWSVGCIVAEMLNRRQLFPGKDHISQLKLIVCCLGTPQEDVMKEISSDIIKRIIIGMGPKPPLPWSSILPKSSASAVSMVACLLRMAPWERLTAKEALDHPYLAEFSDPSSEITADGIVDLSVDVESLNPEQLKQAMLAEADKFQKCRNIEEKADKPSDAAGIDIQISSSISPNDHDVEMLSSTLQETNIDEIHHQSACASMDLKQKLKEKLLQGKSSQMSSGLVTAQKRYQEREEKRRKRAEKIAEKLKRNDTGQSGAVSSDSVETEMSQNDRKLMERWEKLSENATNGRPVPPEASFGDLIVQALPPEDNADSESGKQLNSAELYKIWKEAASMDGVNPEELVEKDWHMNSP